MEFSTMTYRMINTFCWKISCKILVKKDYQRYMRKNITWKDEKQEKYSKQYDIHRNSSYKTQILIKHLLKSDRIANNDLRVIKYPIL